MNNEDSVSKLIAHQVQEPTQNDEEFHIQDNEEEIGPIDDDEN